ncbi:MAG: hypothetical protein L6Q99_11910 [Planctomycetes bacterium]|nr:hypothetical protein [Planctomycetota bacterium]
MSRTGFVSFATVSSLSLACLSAAMFGLRPAALGQDATPAQSAVCDHEIAERVFHGDGVYSDFDLQLTGTLYSQTSGDVRCLGYCINFRRDRRTLLGQLHGLVEVNASGKDVVTLTLGGIDPSLGLDVAASTMHSYEVKIQPSGTLDWSAVTKTSQLVVDIHRTK